MVELLLGMSPADRAEFRADEEEEDLVVEMLTNYIGELIERHDIFLNYEEEDCPKETLGTICIIIDDGAVGEYLHNSPSGQRILVICAPSIEYAEDVEDVLMEWAFDFENTLTDVVKSFRPNGGNLDFYKNYIDRAVNEISAVFLNAIIIPADSFIGLRLRNAAVRAGYADA
ncbi:MAG: hypothetical protein UT41_C0001G0451 [Candidatus Wolfebacteria bacterium GW2011_GWC2_39_22]|uniref:Uncharacterized protein n=2 Tax=Candidatus Wolfeibacteriota TaxID=1752735 RepID=A0A0G1HBC9_9BACT|nr:MAG: hypothetical protein UT41_C0001G0451 [Candidatus Wolfebacteria bacterium GW2011_GWC2_39_22]KKT43838.1 MAG: hypothetical protein UW32_C0001G0430 [Candidatus Wolfebacteria bacterium GW2011_GWE2_44_13]HBI25435.1 hypothetical protein [Candidatus Wolfebacteria bacterium]